MIRLFYFSLTVAVSLGCQSPNIEVIDADQLKSLQSDGVQVVDVRTEQEFWDGHLPEVGLNIDFFSKDFIEKMDAFEKDQPIIIYCKKGGRSAKAAKVLITNGFTKVYDYAGGYSDWMNRKERVEK